jgi:hypothetical protein
LKIAGKDVDALITAVHSQKRVEGLTHNFYKYPARFSPQFAQAATHAFTDPGEIVADPFVGGGTTLVEARASGRIGVGTDISTLATFVSRTKTRVLSGPDVDYLSNWFRAVPDWLNLRKKSTGGLLAELGYTKNLDCPETWAIRKAIEICLSEVKGIKDRRRQDAARCILLRTAQWALDGRRVIPTVAEFRDRIVVTSEELLAGAREFAAAARRGDSLASAGGRHRTVCLNGRAEGLADYFAYSNRPAPKLILTSPPYPGVHILYHRWQVGGGRETAAPFWIADKLDGAGAAYYLMHARQPDLKKYTAGIAAAFTGIAQASAADTTVIQMVAFSNPRAQLRQYLDVMHQCGFQEYLLSEHLDSSDGRIWRNIPGRKWYANKKGKIASSKEVVLIHRPR